MKKERIFSKRRVTSDETLQADTVAWSKKFDGRRAFDVLLEAQRCWDAMGPFRRERHRMWRYVKGDQWGDYITVDGKTMTEETYIKKQGNVPLKNNLMRRLVRNVLGVYRDQNKEPTCVARDREEQVYGETFSTLLQYNGQINNINELHARGMEEFLVSGAIVHRKWAGWNRADTKYDCWTDAVNLNNFFIDSNMRDVRGWDVKMLGEVHDIDFITLCNRYAHSPEDYRRLRDIYRYSHDRNYMIRYCEDFGRRRLENYDFLLTTDPAICKVIEVWRIEGKPRMLCRDTNKGELFKIEIADRAELVDAVNAKRIADGVAQGMDVDDIPLIEIVKEWYMDNYWYYYHLTPFGDILEEGETPYVHKSHPYVFKFYPFVDGEVFSYVSDFLDQQRYTNRLITLYDWIMRSSSKGVLLVPEESIGSMDIEEIADEWSRFNGVIAIKTKNGVPLPQQIANNAVNIGISELLNIQLKFFEDISGVHGALQGKSGNSGTSGTLYAQQTHNATTSLLDLLETYSTFVVDGAYKNLKNIQQFYDEKTIYNITGKRGLIGWQDVECDVAITESTTTPAYRQFANDYLMQFWAAGQLSLIQLLKHGSFPFADALLQELEAQQQQVQQGQVPQGILAELAQQVQQGANMDAVNRGYEMLTARKAA